MENKVPTIREIARRLNVSVSTVSRAMSNHPRIGLQTRLRVQELAKELNYEPNPKALFFKQKKTYVIGVILPFIREDFFSEAIRAMETLALDNDYTLLLGQSFDDFVREQRVAEAFRKQRVDGLIISLSKETRQYQHLDAFQQIGIPVVYFDRVPPGDKVHKVFCNIYTGTIALVDWLLQQKKKRIAFINGPDKMPACRERLKGYMDALAARKIKVDMQLVENTDFSREATWQAMERLFSAKKSPEAVISFNDYIHLDAVAYAHQAVQVVPESVAFVSYANLPFNAHAAYPPAASLEQFPFVQGTKAMEILMQLLQQGTDNMAEQAFRVEEISPQLVIHP